jgi:hypothetical protein
VVSLVVPAVPVVFVRRDGNLVLRVVRPRDDDQLAGFGPSASLGSRYFRGAFADHHLRFRVGIDEDAILAFSERMDRHVGRVNFRSRLAALQQRVGNESLPDLDLDLRACQIRDFRSRAARHAQDVRIVQLYLRSRIMARRDAVARDDRRVQRHGYPIAIVTALRRDIAVDIADSRCARLRLSRFWGLLLFLRAGRSGARKQEKRCQTR